MKKRILSLLLVLMMIVSLVPTAAMAYSSADVAYAVTGGNIYFNESTGTITDCDTSVTEAIIPSEINGVAVTSIGEDAFYNNAKMTAIEIPDSVASIGSYAFYGCKGLTKIEIPDSVTIIGNCAFACCAKLVSIEIPDSVTSIGYGAFHGCTGLTSIKLPSSITEINSSMFSGCSSLKSIEIPSKVTRISTAAFSGCESLEEVKFPDGLTYIYGEAFKNCSSLQTLDFPNKLDYVGASAFEGCTSLTNVNFQDRSSYSFITIGSSAYGYAQIEDSAFKNCTSLKTVKLPYNLYEVSDYAFMNCRSLETIELRACTVAIGVSAFSGCSALNNVSISKSVTSIGNAAFRYCDSLTDIYYGSCKPDWDKISIDSYNETLTNAEVHFTHNYKTTVTAPTCTEKGYTTHTCSTCGDSYVDDYTESLGHDYKAVVTAPTCTEKGYTTYTCSTCGDSYVDDYTESLGHDYKAVVTAPTCTEKGYTTHTCTNCGDSYVADYVDALGHDNQIENAKAAICTEAGYTGDKVCKRCGAETEKGTVINALGHDYKNGKCTRCGAIDPSIMTFVDVAADAYYYHPVQWAVVNGITNGTDDTHFSPDQGCTRGQVVTFLWRAAGSPKVSGDAGFVDVKSTDYFYDAVKWAVANGITNGTDATHFSPSATCTRGQVVTFMYRAEGSPATSGSCAFVDVSSTAYYHDAVIWAVANNITNGTDATHFSPSNTCTRAQVVTFLYRNAEK